MLLILSATSADSFFLRDKHTRRRDLSHRRDLPVLFDELNEHIGKLGQMELESFVGNQFLIGRAGLHNEETAAGSEYNLELASGWRLIGSGDALCRCFIQLRRTTHERHFAFIK